MSAQTKRYRGRRGGGYLGGYYSLVPEVLLCISIYLGVSGYKASAIVVLGFCIVIFVVVSPIIRTIEVSPTGWSRKILGLGTAHRWSEVELLDVRNNVIVVKYGDLDRPREMFPHGHLDIHDPKFPKGLLPHIVASARTNGVRTTQGFDELVDKTQDLKG